MRILHVLDHSAPLHSGYTFRTLSILTAQRHMGWDTVHVTGSKQGSSELEEDANGFHFYRTPPTQGLASRLPIFRQLAVIGSLESRLRGLVAELQPDVIHAHSPALNGIAACNVGRDLGIPVVYEVRAFWEDAAVDNGTGRRNGPRYLLSRALESHVLRRANDVTTICRGLADEIIGRGIPHERVTVIPNAVNVEDFTTNGIPDAKLADELGLAGAEVVGFLGSFYPYEGLDLLLLAMASLKDQRPQLRLLLVGGGPDEELLRQRTRELGLQDRVIFTGRVPFEEVSSYYDLVDVLAYPRYHSRLTDLVTPLKPLEAMAMGKVLVASDVGGHRELIQDGETGLLFQAGDAADLASKLTQCLDDQGLKEKMKREGRQWVERERTWTKSVEKYAGVYPSDPTPARGAASA